jgi:hypothetical protein
MIKLTDILNTSLTEELTSAESIEHMKLLSKAMKTMPGSPKQKEIIKQLNVLRIKGGMKPLKEINDSVIKEGLTMSIRNVFSELVPKEIYNAITPNQKERRKSFVRDLVKTLNHFYKQNDIDWRFADTDFKFKMYSK